MTTGTVVSYDPEKGHGFVRPDGNDDKVPFETDEALALSPGDRIQFDLEGGLAGEMAHNVRRVSGAGTP